ncbi:MAG: hypothetical protein WCI36_01230 [bacterium]
MDVKRVRKNIKITLLATAIVVLFLFVKYYKAPDLTSSANADLLAQCIKANGAKFYGASWCSHCQNQKKLLGNSKNIPYIECSAPDGKSQLPICTENKIEGYPTWVFADGTRQSGEISLEELAKKTNCNLL